MKKNIGFITLDSSLVQWLRETLRTSGPQSLSAQELLEGFRDYALAQFGPMASTVMKEWGLRNGKNVGEMVFLLIEEDVFSKQPEDSLDDFKGFMSFRKAFEEPYEFQDQPS